MFYAMVRLPSSLSPSQMAIINFFLAGVELISGCISQMKNRSCSSSISGNETMNLLWLVNPTRFKGYMSFVLEYEGKHDPCKLEDLGNVLTSWDPRDSIVVENSLTCST